MGSSDPRDGQGAVDAKTSSCMYLRAYPRPDGSPILWAMAEEQGKKDKVSAILFLFNQKHKT